MKSLTRSKSLDSLKEVQRQISIAKESIKAKDYDAAEEILLKIIKKHQLADVYNLLGSLYADQGQFNFAEVAFKKALKINPAYMEASLNLAVIYNNLGKRKESKEIYARLSKYGKSGRGAMDPVLMARIANLYAEIGDLCRSVGEYKDAVKAYEAAVDLCPQFIDIQTKLATSIREAGDGARALKLLEKIKRKASSYAPYWVALGVTYYARNRRRDAKAAWKKALKLEPKNTTVRAYSNLVA